MTQAQTERPDYELAREEMRALMKAHDLRIESVFVPFSKSRNAPGVYDPGPLPPGSDSFERQRRDRFKRKGWRSLNWKVTLQKAPPVGKVHDIAATEYSQGEGHCPAVKWFASKKGTPFYRTPHTLDWETAVMHEMETGRTWQGESVIGPRRGPEIHPDSAEVFGCMCDDAQSVLDSGSFEDWAANYGYDTDSRHAEKIYSTCRDSAVKLVAALGSETLAKAADIARRF